MVNQCLVCVRVRMLQYQPKTEWNILIKTTLLKIYKQLGEMG